MPKNNHQVLFVHVLHILLYFLILSLFQYFGKGLDSDFWIYFFEQLPFFTKYQFNKSHFIEKRSIDQASVIPNISNDIFYKTSYGFFGNFMLTFLQYLSLIALPIMFFQFCGLVFFPAFPESPDYKKIKHKKYQPFICFRVVTRGNFPELVMKNVHRNYNLCKDLKLVNFIFQIVTDKSIGFNDQPMYIKERHDMQTIIIDKNMKIDIFQLVVPDNYVTQRGSLFKARALQYALEDVNHFLSDDDWIVHLDEETLLTNDSIIGILNFVYDGKCDFGQGLITYAKDGVVNWLTTLADTFRVADDMGKNRFQLKVLGKPVFNWKGSYVVTRAAAERKVTFDVGVHGSIAEDCYFAMNAIKLHQALPPSKRLPRPSRVSDSDKDHFTWNSTHKSKSLGQSIDIVSNFNTNIPRREKSKSMGGDDYKLSPIGDNFNFRFDFIEGEMLEKSPFTILDFLKQRKRWLQGIYLVVHKCPELPFWSVKLGLVIFVYAWILMPVICLNEVLLARVWPLPAPRLLRALTAFVSGTTVYMYAFGAVKSFVGGAVPVIPLHKSIPRPLSVLFGGHGFNQESNNFRKWLPLSMSGPTGATRSVSRSFLLTNATSSSSGSSGGASLNVPSDEPFTYGQVNNSNDASSENSAVVNLDSCLEFRNIDLEKPGYHPPKKFAGRTSKGCASLRTSFRKAKRLIKEYTFKALFVVFCIIGSLAMIPFNVCIEVVAVIWGLISKKHQFYIVSKQVS